MSNPTKNVKLRALINAAITELYPEITIDQLILDGDTTLAAKIAEIVAAVNLRAKIADVDADMEALKNELTSGSTSYTDAKIAELINGAPSTLDTLKEVADAMAQNASVVEALNTAIGTKANQTDFAAHTADADIHHKHSNKTVLDATTASFTTAEKSKLKDIESGAEVNQNAFAVVKIGDESIMASAKSDILTLEAGDNVTLTLDVTGKKIIVTAKDTTYGNATTSTAGLMSAGDKTKLDSIAAGAEVNQNAFAKVVVGGTTIEADSKSDSLTLAAGSNITLTPDASGDKVTIAAKDTTYVEATSSASGLMSATDKAKLDSIKVGEASSLEGLNASVTELNYMSGATSNIQAQINALQAAINAINSALPYSITINDSAKTINFTDR